MQSTDIQAQSVALEDVSAVFQSHIDWKAGPRTRSVAVLPFLPQLVRPGQDTLPVYSERDHRDKQLEDRCLSRVLFYI